MSNISITCFLAAMALVAGTHLDHSYAQAPRPRDQQSDIEQLQPDLLAAQIIGEATLRGKTSGQPLKAEAKILAAETSTRWVDPELKNAESFWEKKLIGIRGRNDAELLRLDAFNKLGQARLFTSKSESLRRRELIELRDENQWATIKDHPELKYGGIINGDALNFLFDRLNAKVFLYSNHFPQSAVATQLLSEIGLTPQLIQQLWLVQNSGNGQRIEFRVDHGPLGLTGLPFLLRDDQFISFRKDFERSKKAVMDEASQGEITFTSSARLRQSLHDFSTQFERVYNVERRKTADGRMLLHILAADRFFRSMEGQLLRFETLGSGETLAELKFDSDKDGKHLLGLLAYMSRNGLKFAPAKPGGESAYQTVFGKMRQLYFFVEAKDEH